MVWAILKGMGDATGQMLLFAAGISLSPFPIIAVVLMLGTPRARSNGPAFILGWIFGLSLAGTMLLLVATGTGVGDDGEPSQSGSYLGLGLGLLMLGFALKQFLGRPRGGAEPEPPAWMASVDRFTPVRAAGIGVLLSAANPKILILLAGGVAAITQADTTPGAQAAALALFVVLASIGPLVPVGIYLRKGERAAEGLETIRSWMARHNWLIMSIIFVLVGVRMIGNSISGFTY